MLQRIQSVYLALAGLILAVGPFLLPLGYVEGTPFYAVANPLYMAAFGMGLALVVISIMYYNKRQLQFVLNRLNIILQFILLGLFLYRSLNLSGEAAASEKGIGLLIPIISIVLLVVANRAIKKDEALVKSVDRLR